MADVSGSDMKTESFIRKHRVFILLLLYFAVYAGIYAYNLSFMAEGERHFVIADDMLISMRYAQNLADGEGLVFNPGGPRVEGYTNPLVVLFMSAIHLFPLPLSKTSLPVIVTFLLLLFVNLFLVRKLALRVSGGSEFIALGAVALTATFCPLNVWSITGYSVAPLTLLVTLCALLAIDYNARDKPLTPVFVIAAAGTLIRPDFVVPYIAIFLFSLLYDKERRKFHFIAGAGILILFIGSQTIFRLIYFGELLPNTYYLKLTGYPLLQRVTRGFYIFLKSVVATDALLMMAPFFILLFKRDRKMILLFIVVIMEALYSIYVGGDVWEEYVPVNRFVSVVVPLYLITISYLLYHVCEYIVTELREHNIIKESGKLPSLKIIFTIVIVASVFSINSNMLNVLLPYRTAPQKSYARKLVLKGYALKKVTTAYAEVATPELGTVAYFSERYMIDVLGKVDKKIARQRSHTIDTIGKYIYFIPGHTKYDYEYSIKKKKPDVIIALWHNPETIKPYIKENYIIYKFKKSSFDYMWYLKKDSRHIIWENLDRLKKNSGDNNSESAG